MATEQLEAEAAATTRPVTTTTTMREKPPFNELHSLKRVASKTFKLMSKTNSNLNSDVASSSDSVATLKGQLEEANREVKNKDQMVISMKSDVQKMKETQTQLVEKEALIAALNEEIHTFKSSIVHKDHMLSDQNKRVEDLEAELERIKDSHDKLIEANQESKSLIDGLKLQQDKTCADNDKLTAEIQRLENELELQRNRTANKEIIMLRNELKSAMGAEEKSKQAMDELAEVIKEISVEANQTQDKLALAEEENEMLRNTVAWLKTEAEESLLAWSAKEVEFVRCIKKEEDDKANLQEENKKLLQDLKEFEDKSEKLFEETKNIRDAFKAVMEENSQLKREKTIARLTLHDKQMETRWEEVEEEEHKKPIPSSSKSQEERKSVSTPSKNEAKSSASGGGVEEKEHRRLMSSSLLPSFKKETKKDTEVMKGHGHMKSHGTSFHFHPKTVFPIPGMASKSREVPAAKGDDNGDDGLTDSIFDLVSSSPPRVHHRRKSSLEGHKSICLEEFEHERGTMPHLDDMEVERAGSHGTKRSMLLRKFGDFWRWKAQAPTGTHPHNHHDYQTQNLDEKVVTT